MHIAVVRDTWKSEAVGACGEAVAEVAPATTAQAVAAALADDGHSVMVCEADSRLQSVLRRFMPPTAEGAPTGMVFNLAREGYGDAARTQVPALLDLACVPYTGPTPLGHAVAFDTLLWRSLLRHGGVPSPPFDVIRWRGEEARMLNFPLVASPRFKRPGSRPRLVRSRRELLDAVEEILTVGEQEAVIAECPDSVELSCGLLGNGDELELLPIIERHGVDTGDPGHVAAIGSSPLGLRVGAIAASAFRAVHCQDYARVVVRFDRMGRPIVVDVDSMPRLDRDSSLVLAALAADYGQSVLVARILDTAHHRYFGVAAPRFDISARDRVAPALRLIG
jgi:D-alanine-D-alanine ligase